MVEVTQNGLPMQTLGWPNRKETMSGDGRIDPPTTRGTDPRDVIQGGFMREERLGSGPSRFKDPRSEAMLEPEEVSAIFRLNELGWGAKRISREYLIDPEC